jgi:hypothetical protein
LSIHYHLDFCYLPHLLCYYDDTRYDGIDPHENNLWNLNLESVYGIFGAYLTFTSTFQFAILCPNCHKLRENGRNSKNSDEIFHHSYSYLDPIYLGLLGTFSDGEPNLYDDDLSRTLANPLL